MRHDACLKTAEAPLEKLSQNFLYIMLKFCDYIYKELEVFR